MNFDSYNQNIKKHLWKDRVLIIESENTRNTLYQQQIEVLKNDAKGLKERKLVVYWYFNDGYLNSEQMTAELEDMKQAGSNKVIFLGVDQE